MAVQVNDCKLAKSGKCYNVVLSGEKYLANLDSGLNANIGKWIEAEIQPSKDPKFPAWVGKWVHASTVAAPQVPPPTQAGHSPLPAPAVAAPRYAEQNDNTAPWWWPSVSNVWAAQSAAGNIKEPGDLKMWALAVKAAAKAAVATTQATQDEDIPF